MSLYSYFEGAFDYKLGAEVGYRRCPTDVL